MNKTILITVLLTAFLLVSWAVNSESPKAELHIPITDHKADRLEIKARSFANESSKKKQDFEEFMLKMTEQERKNAAKLLDVE